MRFIDWINDWVGKIFCWTVVVLALLVVVEVILRRVFNRPTIWNFETTLQLYAFHFLIMIPHTLLHNGHVNVDIVYDIFKPRTKAILSIISYCVFFIPFMTVLIYQGIKYANYSWSVLERSWSVFGPPLYPIKTVIPIMAILLTLQGLSIMAGEIKKLKKN
jgi:TRAP-type mannitol/chloroaromatic compound transport system permease small subunit